MGNSLECVNNVHWLRVGKSILYTMTSPVSTAGAANIKVTIYGQLRKRQAPRLPFHLRGSIPPRHDKPHVEAVFLHHSTCKVHLNSFTVATSPRRERKKREGTTHHGDRLPKSKKSSAS